MPGGQAEYRCHADGAQTAVVFIHGILGSPSQFTYLVDGLHGRYTVENLLLPGHGCSSMDFAGSSMAQWQAHVDARVAELERTYPHIILVGHSMGCLLAVQAALSYPAHIRGLFLLAIPLVIRVKSPSVMKRMTAVLDGEGTQATEDRPEVLKDTTGRGTAGQPLKHLAALPRFIELFIKSRKTRHLIEDIKVPVFVIPSEYDETVGIRSFRYIERLPNASVMIANESSHFFYPPETKKLIADALAHFIGQVVSENTEKAVATVCEKPYTDRY